MVVGSLANFLLSLIVIYPRLESQTNMFPSPGLWGSHAMRLALVVREHWNRAGMVLPLWWLGSHWGHRSDGQPGGPARLCSIIHPSSLSLSRCLDCSVRRSWLICNLSLSSRILKVDSMFAWIHSWPLEENMLKGIFEKLDRVYTCTWKDMCERWENCLAIFPVALS